MSHCLGGFSRGNQELRTAVQLVLMENSCGSSDQGLRWEGCLSIVIVGKAIRTQKDLSPILRHLKATWSGWGVLEGRKALCALSPGIILNYVDTGLGFQIWYQIYHRLSPGCKSWLRPFLEGKVEWFMVFLSFFFFCLFFDILSHNLG